MYTAPLQPRRKFRLSQRGLPWRLRRDLYNSYAGAPVTNAYFYAIANGDSLAANLYPNARGPLAAGR